MELKEEKMRDASMFLVSIQFFEMPCKLCRYKYIE
jgi:hypothetical protein